MPSHTSDTDTFASAVLLGEPKIVRSALAHGVDPNAVGQDGTPPIILAVVKGHEEVVDLLLEAGADINRPDRGGGMTALHAAVLNGLEAIARRLIDRGADVNAFFGQPPMTALSLAFRRGFKSLVSRLVEAGADPNSPINSPSDPPAQRGTTPLIYAASVGDIEMLRLLTAHGANPDQPKDDGITPLMAAAFTGQFEAVMALVDVGARVGVVNEADPTRSFSALDLATSRGHERIVTFLRASGGTPSQ